MASLGSKGIDDENKVRQDTSQETEVTDENDYLKGVFSSDEEEESEGDVDEEEGEGENDDDEEEESESESGEEDDSSSEPEVAIAEMHYIGEHLHCEDLIGKPYLLAQRSLRTVDWSNRFNLLDAYKKDSEEPSITILHNDEEKNMRLFNAKNLLSEHECRTIVEVCQNKTLQNMGELPGYKRKNSRLVVFDKQFAEMLWERVQKPLEEVFSKKDIRLFPLGFNVAKGQWKFSGVNEAMRFNKYESFSSDMFAPHRDAQFCPSGDERSMLSVVIYLNENFDGGETKFYFPKQEHASKGVAMEEELKLNGGLEEGYHTTTVKPTVGNAVIFTQNVIHESVPLNKKEEDQVKFIIKTDVILKRSVKHLGFSVSEDEQKDYVKCLNFFRMAQQKELHCGSEEGKDDDDAYQGNANCLYEKCLSIRYCYPTKKMLADWSESSHHEKAEDILYPPQKSDLSSSQRSIVSSVEEEVQSSVFSVFPCEVWLLIMRNLTSEDLINIVQAFPHLEHVKRKLNEKKIVPVLGKVDGLFSQFTFDFGDFVENNLDACCRVVAVYSVFLLGHPKDTNMYTVRYDEEKNEAAVVELETLLKSVFYGEECYGAIMKVLQQGNEKEPMEDLLASTDRMFMTTKFGKEFVSGKSIESEFIFDERIVEQRRTSWSDDFSTEYKKYRHKNVFTFWDRFLTLSGKVSSFDVEEIYQNEVLIFPSYYEVVTKFSNPQYVGGAVVRQLPKPVELDGSESCLCPMSGFRGDEKISKNFETKIFNHLIADFKRQELTVTETPEEKLEPCCHLLNPLLDYVTEELKPDTKLREFIVNVTPLQNGDISFHHANCFCNVPDIKLEAYVNLRSYPYLNHVHIVMTRDGERMKVCTSYGGVAAL